MSQKEFLNSFRRSVMEFFMCPKFCIDYRTSGVVFTSVRQLSTSFISFNCSCSQNQISLELKGFLIEKRLVISNYFVSIKRQGSRSSFSPFLMTTKQWMIIKKIPISQHLPLTRCIPYLAKTSKSKTSKITFLNQNNSPLHIASFTQSKHQNH